MAAQGEQDFKWLKSMDSEAIISTVASLKGTREEKSLPVALTTKKRTPRKRTKSVKAAEAEEVADLLDADSAPPAKKPCAEVVPATPAPPQPLPAAPPSAVLDHSQAAGAVPLFKPVSDQPAAPAVERSNAPSQIPAAEDAGGQLTEEVPPAVNAVQAPLQPPAPEPPGPAVPTWPAQHIAPVEQVTDEGVAEPEPVQTLEHDPVKYEVRPPVNLLFSFSPPDHVDFTATPTRIAQ